MKYGTLSQRHPAHLGEDWRELDILHRGGLALERYRENLIPRRVDHRGRQEPLEVYEQRIGRAAYINYFGRVVSYFSQALFSRQLSMTPAEGDAVEMAAYDAFAEDADRKGSPFAELCRDVITTALVKGKGLLAVDLPPAADPGEVLTRFDEERLGLGVPYAYPVAVEDLIDWRHDDHGGFEWCILHRVICERTSPESSRDEFAEEFKVWQLAQTESGPRAVWRIFRTPTQRRDQARRIQDHEDVPLVAEGATSFQRVPLIELALPEGLWIGDHVGPMAREHFQRRSGIVHAEDQTLYAIPYVKLGPQLAASGAAVLPDVAQDQSRGEDPIAQAEQRGWMTLASGDEVGFASPDPKAYEHAHARLDALVDEIFRVSHQMAQSITSTGKALQRSGVSKAEDRHSTEVVLGALGDVVRRFAVTVYDTIAAARGDETTWQPNGLDTFEVWDREQLVDEGTKVRSVDIPSKTFQRLYYGQVATKLLGDVTPDVRARIEDEIEQAVEAMPDPSDPPEPPDPPQPDDDAEDPDDDAETQPPPRPPRRRVVTVN